MKNRRPYLLVLVLGAVLVACAFGFWAAGPRQPEYKGKPISYWIALGNAQQLPGRGEADTAVRAIGTNALPYLIHLVEHKDSPFKRKLLSISRNHSWFKLPFHDASLYHAESTYGFGVLRELAKPAVPALTQLLKDSDPEVRAYAAFDLGNIGPEAEEAIPALLPLLDDRTNGVPILHSMYALGQIHNRPEVVLPRLRAFLDGDRADWNYATPALQAIGGYKTAARHLAPLMATFLNHQDADKRAAADAALLNVDPQFDRTPFQPKKGSE